MRILSTLVIGTLGIGCVADDATTDELEPVDDVAEPAETPNAALCYVPPTPPAANISFDLDQAPSPFIYAVQNYGTGECSGFTSSWVGAGSFKAYVAEPTTAEACVGTTMYVRRYLRDYAGWKLNDTRTIHGEWTADGCEIADYGAVLWDYYPSEYRLHVRVHRTFCSGQLCGTQYGVPFKLRGTP